MADDVERSRLPDRQHLSGGAVIVVRHLAAGDTLPGDHAAIDEREGTSTWQDALAALARRCDLVLMDLRGFQAHNAGCVHELGVLARCRARVVALTDAHTDRAAAQQAAAGAPDGGCGRRCSTQ